MVHCRPRSSVAARLDRLQSSVDELRNRVELLARASNCPSVPAASHARPKTSTLLTGAEMAELLTCDPRTLRRWELAGEVPKAIHIGGAKRWRGGEVAAWLEAKRK